MQLDHIDSIFGPGKIKKYPGHEEIELALIKLYRVTGQKRYLTLSEFFIQERGKQPSFIKDETTFKNHKNKKWFNLEYHQAHAPVREQTKVTGHAVRAMYFYSAITDLAMETNDESLFTVLETLWDNMTSRRMYITGGLGSQGYAERFTFDYDLPNDTAHAETCASIGLLFWAHRMLMLEKNRKYADIFEKTLYNGCLSGISWDGKAYFYSNPLEVFPEAVNKRYDLSHISPRRLPWYGCACCPPNIARVFTSLHNYIASVDEGILYMHHYIEGRIELKTGSRTIIILQKTKYPWDGKITIQIASECDRELPVALRIPGWCNEYECRINGQKQDNTHPEKGYLKIKKYWKKDDIIELNLTMEIQLIQSHPKVRENSSMVAIQRGPFIYCLEETDNGSNLRDITLTHQSSLVAEFSPDFFGGMVLIKGTGLRTDEKSWENTLYQPYQYKPKEIDITAVPYFIWANRKPGEMLVWIKYKQ